MNLINFGECFFQIRHWFSIVLEGFFFLSHLNVLVIVKVFCQTQMSTENIAIDDKEFGGYTYHGDAYLLYIWVFAAPWR